MTARASCLASDLLVYNGAAENHDTERGLNLVDDHANRVVRTVGRSPKLSLDEVIVRDPKICGGEAVIRDTRVTLRTVLASLADGDGVKDILRDFPTLTERDVQAVIAFAAAAAQEDLPTPGVPI